MKTLYDLFLLLYPLGARVLSLKNEKARHWLQGRRNIFDRLATVIKHDQRIIWVHCSSLGEFEQGKPLIERMRQQFPATRVLLTFFSPSGYEIQKNYEGADYIFYLPLDSRWNAARFFDIVNPALIIFIKYEFWYYYFQEARLRNVPLVLASGVFRKSQPFFQWYGKFYREMLDAVSCFFVQDENSVELLKYIAITNVVLTGDTRFDRVLAIAKENGEVKEVGLFCGDHPVIVAGSTWMEDDEELDHYANVNPHIKFIIAPHDVGSARIEQCLALYKNSITLSALQAGANIPVGTNVLIVDCVGLLSKLYRYYTISYIGGGFGGDGVHNVLEAAVYGRPVVFGPVYEKYIEAVQLIESGGGFSIENALELENRFDLLLDDAFLYKQACLASKVFVEENAGATEKITSYIQENRLFTT
jgi:3-deoxy-D-manno-octulosonic-acid transferase